MKNKRTRSHSSPRRKSDKSTKAASAKKRRARASASEQPAEANLSPASLPPDAALMILSFSSSESTSHFLSTCSTLSRLSPDAWKQKLRALQKGGPRSSVDGNLCEGVSAAAYWNGRCRTEHATSVTGRYDFPAGESCLPCYTAVAKVDDQTFAVSYGGRCIKVWDTLSGLCLRTWRLRDHDVAFILGNDDNGRTFVTMGPSRVVKLWDVRTGKCLRTSHNGHPERRALGIVRTGRDTFVTWSSVAVKELNVRTGRVSALVTDIAFSGMRCSIRAVTQRDERRLIIVGDRQARIFDTNEHEFVAGGFSLPPFFRGPSVARISERRVVVACNHEVPISGVTFGLWDSDSGKILMVAQAEGAPTIGTVANIGDDFIVVGSDRANMVLISMDVSRVVNERRVACPFADSLGVTSVAMMSKSEFVIGARGGIVQLFRKPRDQEHVDSE